MVSLNNQSVLLQTVNIVVSDELNKTFITVKALFDSGSIKTYVSQRLLDALNLKPISKQDLFVSSFVSASGKLVNSNCFNVCLKSVDE